ncbi:ABC transporter substrate-binding protein [Oscillospiraceae bacterium WX1]
MKRVLSALLVLLMAFALTACSTASPKASETSNPPLAASVGVLKGPTGIGASFLMEQRDQGKTDIDYTFTTEADPANITSGLINGSLDLAAVPTNVAAVLYNKTQGNVKIIAINTMSVLYLLENGTAIASVSDLRGKTIYATGQGANPEYVLNYILEQNGLKPGVDVTIEYMDSSQLATEMAAGTIDVAMLPVPNATTVLLKNPDVHIALDFGKEWSALSGADGSVLTQGCIVARMDAPDIDVIIPQFLSEYQASINFMLDDANLDTAAQLAYKHGMVGSVEIAKAAIPQCHLTYIAGAADMKAALAGYLDVLFKADPKSVGGAVPNDNFYYGG